MLALSLFTLLANFHKVISANQLYKQMTFPTSIWPPYVYQEANVAKTLIECGAMCSSNNLCGGFHYAGPGICKLADLERDSNIIGTQTATTMYISIGKLQNSPISHCISMLVFNKKPSLMSKEKHCLSNSM